MGLKVCVNDKMMFALILVLLAGGGCAQYQMITVATLDTLVWRPVRLGNRTYTPPSAMGYYQNVTRVFAYGNKTDANGTPVLRMEVSARELDGLRGAMIATLSPMPPLAPQCSTRNINVFYNAAFQVETDTRIAAYGPGLSCNVIVGSDWSTEYNMSGLAFMFAGGGNRTNVTNTELEPTFPIGLVAPVSMTRTCDNTAKSICPQMPNPMLPPIRAVNFTANFEFFVNRNDSRLDPYFFRVANGTTWIISTTSNSINTDYPGFNFIYTGNAWLGLHPSASGPNLFFSSRFTNLTIYEVTVKYFDSSCTRITSTESASLNTNTTSSVQDTLTSATAPLRSSSSNATDISESPSSSSAAASVSTAPSETDTDSGVDIIAAPSDDGTFFGLVAAGVVAALLLCCALSIYFMRHYGPRSPTLLRLYAQTPGKAILCICCRGPMEEDELTRSLPQSMAIEPLIQRTGSDMDLASMALPSSSAGSDDLMARARRMRDAQAKRQSAADANIEYGKLPPPSVDSTGLIHDYTAIPLDESTAGALAKAPPPQLESGASALPATTRTTGAQRQKNQSALAASLAKGSAPRQPYHSIRARDRSEYDIVHAKPPAIYDQVEEIDDCSSELETSGSAKKAAATNNYESVHSKLT